MTERHDDLSTADLAGQQPTDTAASDRPRRPTSSGATSATTSSVVRTCRR